MSMLVNLWAAAVVQVISRSWSFQFSFLIYLVQYQMGTRYESFIHLINLLYRVIWYQPKENVPSVAKTLDIFTILIALCSTWNLSEEVNVNSLASMLQKLLYLIMLSNLQLTDTAGSVG